MWKCGSQCWWEVFSWIWDEFRYLHCTITMAGLWAIANELQVFKNRGFMHIEIESDSMTVLSLISNGCSMWHRCYNLVRQVKDLIELFSSYSLNHVHCCEANQVANGLAKFGLSLPLSIRIFLSFCWGLPLYFHHKNKLNNI